jgi:KUP system potassium uptake protein
VSESNSASLNNQHKRLIALIIGALGVVYGDIGTSPLYALRECFGDHHALQVSSFNVYGVLSLVIWSLIIIVSIKYLTFVMRADNKGEGGILALMVYALRKGGDENSSKRKYVIYLGLFGGALIYGDGIITPAISVLSAVEGIEVIAPSVKPYILPIAVFVLTALFLAQKEGTRMLGTFFGPIIILWFLTIGFLGIINIGNKLEVLTSFNPIHGFLFLKEGGKHAVYVLGSVFLAVTGAEALYADMGHFGKKPIRYGWFFLVMPGLILNYLGQGALILSNPSTVKNPFYLLAPDWLILPLVLLATATTVIASQALISGAFSMTGQAIHLGYLPRLKILHTSSSERGQIYVPLVNWILFIGTIALVILFQSSTHLAAAYGIAVSTTMVITSLLMAVVAKDSWKWSLFTTSLVLILFLVVDGLFLIANSMKFFDGGWLPLFLGILLLLVMTTWWRGRKILWTHLKERLIPFNQWRKTLNISEITRVPGVSIFMIRDLQATPPALIFNVLHNHIIHEKVVFLSFVTEEVPFIAEPSARVEQFDLGDGFYRVIGHHGFMESVNVQSTLQEHCSILSRDEARTACYFVDRPIPIATQIPGMAMWREELFCFMMQNAQRVTTFFEIPAEQVIEIGFHVEI